MQIGIETLSAYLDSELSEAETRRVDAALASSEQLRSELNALKRANDQATRFFDELDRKPLPDSVVKLIKRMDNDSSTEQHLKITNLAKAERMVQTTPSISWGLRELGLAASLILALGLGYWVSTHPPKSLDMNRSGSIAVQSVISPSNPLYDILEHNATGEISTLRSAEPGEAVVVQTFVSSRGSYCREFHIRCGESSDRLLACRAQSGDWQVLSRAPGTVTFDDSYRLASERDSVEFDRILESLGGGASIAQREEEKLLDSGWNSTSTE